MSRTCTVLHPKKCLLPAAATAILASWFYQSFSLFLFMLHFFLRYSIGDDLWYSCHGFITRLSNYLYIASRTASNIILWLVCVQNNWQGNILELTLFVLIALAFVLDFLREIDICPWSCFVHALKLLCYSPSRNILTFFIVCLSPTDGSYW